MPQYTWPDCPQPIRDEVIEFSHGLKEILGSSALGVYLHGSLAIGGFNPMCSDVDVLVLLDRTTTPREKQAVAQLTFRVSGQPAPLEFSIIRKADIDPWQYPTPFDFHFSEDLRSQMQEELASGAWQNWNTGQPRDPDLAAHITTVRQRGVTLLGLPPSTVLPEVPASDFRASILEDLDWAGAHKQGKPLYAVLNLCRILRYVQDAANGSKREAGQWALVHLPESYHSIVEASLTAYATDGKVNISEAELDAFVSFMSNTIRRVASS